MNLKVLAERLGVSKTTISLALNGHPRISAARREEVQKLAMELGYCPDVAATALAHRKWEVASRGIQGTLAWVNCWHHPKKLREYVEFDSNWRGAEAAALAKGYRLEEFVVSTEAEVIALDRVLISRGIQGVLLPPQETPLDLSGLSWSRLAGIRFGRSIRGLPLNMVAHSQAYNILHAVERCRELGYRRIGMITSARLQRITLYDVGLIKAQQHFPDLAVLPTLVLSEHTEPYLRQLQQWVEENKPDLIVTTEGRMHENLRQAGYLAPRDFGLIASSVKDCDTDSGILQNAEALGRVAVEAALSLVHHGHFGFPDFIQEINLRGSWVQGGLLPALNKEGTAPPVDTGLAPA